jgi:putative ABC transport system permease protein
LRDLLVASEMALALVLLVGAGLMIRTFAALRAIDPGFNPSHVLSSVVSVQGTPAGEAGRRAPFFQELVQRVSGLPGVTAASAINHVPLHGDEWGWPFRIEGRPTPAPGDSPIATYRVVLPGYFRAMQLPLIAGRDVAPSDNLDAAPVVVVSEGLARRYFPGEDPLGKRIAFDITARGPTWVTIVGIVKNARQSNWALEPDPEAYMPYLQNRNYLESDGSWVGYLTLVVRTADAPAALAPTLRATVWSFDRNLTVSDVITMDDVVSEATAGPRFYLVLLGTFAGVALALAAVGIYGVMSYTVARRRHELGIRMALGATAGHVRRLVVRQGMTLAGAGAFVGLIAALGLARLMGALLYSVRPTDAVTFVLVPVVLVGVALAACALPAGRAARIEPVTALRHD